MYDYIASATEASRRNAPFWRKGQAYWSGHKEQKHNDRTGNQERSEPLPLHGIGPLGIWN